jgi:hypothetical protein
MLKKNRYDLQADIVSAINGAYKPYEAIGWPPGLENYIRSVAEMTALAIINSIYTEGELDEQMDKILLTDKTQ